MVRLYLPKGLLLFTRFLIVLLSSIFFLSACDQLPSQESLDNKRSSPSQKPLIISGQTMGTTYSVSVFVPKRSSSNNSENFPPQPVLKQNIQSRLDEIESLMSTYRHDSQVMQFNRLKVGKNMPVDRLTFEVLQQAQYIHKHSEGLFDITVGPLVSLWGFTRDNDGWLPPSDDEVKSVKENLGQEGLSISSLPIDNSDVDDESSTVKKDEYYVLKDKPVQIDLSAIAKGYGVDRAVQYLESIGAKSFMVEVGGEVALGETKPTGEPWRIAIERPEIGARALHRVLALSDVAVATSGNYRNFVTHGGKRYGHTLNPLTGYPVEHALESVTVIFSTSTVLKATLADGWATALLVAGPTQGKRLAELHNIATIFLIRTQTGELEEWQSSQVGGLMVDE